MSTKKDKFSLKDIKYMTIALNLAKQRQGLTGENPSVGCVIVKNNKIISSGQTSVNGRPHAEYNALKSTNKDFKGSSMYVTLEPCNHYGLTPPCTNLITNKKIKKVYYSINDIDKRVRGKTQKFLKPKNIEVKKGLLQNEIKKFYLPYFFNKEKKLPFVTGKIAISKNKIIFSKKKKKITDKYSDKFTHELRYRNNFILISSKTLNNDNPRLTCRLNKLNNHSPKRVIIDNYLNTKINSFVISTVRKKNTIIFYNQAKKEKIKLFKKKGVNLIKVKMNKNKHLDLKQILRKLFILGCRNLLVEGGNDLTGEFLKKGLFNQFYLFKSKINISKNFFYKEFKSFKYLNKNYKQRNNVKIKYTKDSVFLYKK